MSGAESGGASSPPSSLGFGRPLNARMASAPSFFLGSIPRVLEDDEHADGTAGRFGRRRAVAHRDEERDRRSTPRTLVRGDRDLSRVAVTGARGGRPDFRLGVPHGAEAVLERDEKLP